MNTLYIKELFIQFLIDNNIFSNYVKNFYEYKIQIPSYRRNLFCVDYAEHPSTLFVYGFVWHRTKEGETFWRDIHKKWTKFLVRMGYPIPNSY